MMWAAFHRATAKINPVTHKVRYRNDGKILKPPSFRPPDIAAALWGKPKPEVKVSGIGKRCYPGILHAQDMDGNCLICARE